MIIETIPLDIARRRQVLFELNEAVTLSPEEYEEIKPWVSNWYSNAKAGAYSPRFNTQRTYYRCLFHKEKAAPTASKGIRARPTRQPLDKPCPLTMSVVANYASDTQTILNYTVDRNSPYDRCPDHTHDLDLVDQTHRCDGLREIAHHKMWQMAPDAKAAVVFQSMKELPQFEDAGGKHFTCGEVYYIGKKFRKPTDAVAAKEAASEAPANPTSEAEGQPSQFNDGNPPSWLGSKTRKRKHALEARPPKSGARPWPALAEHPHQESQRNSLHITVDREDLLAHYRRPNQSAPSRQLVDPTLEGQERQRYPRDTPPGDIASQVRAILTRPTAGAEHATSTDNTHSPAPIDLTFSPGGCSPPPQASDRPTQWRPSHNDSHQQSQHSNMILPNWMTANGPALLHTRPVQPGRSAIMVEAPVSIGDLLRKAAPSNTPRQSDVSTEDRQAKRVRTNLQHQPSTKIERATLRELLSMQPPTAIESEEGGRFPPNPFT
ncbi:hypothetical protein M436DRAFT_61787 [Aureobasidium namibiae CBS 147.97]|uniref:Uncharacterized protein n=1 Tax=Aureobasidium namibiae CBS 147.97 TaxID=1043004 RepID=A0A074WQC7_9PEZI